MSPALAALATPDPRGLGGLVAVAEGRERPLPLREVRVRARVVGDCCRTEIEQRYANPHEVAVEAVHMLPLPPDGAVTEMELRAGDVVVRAECRARNEAEATFAQAREAGHRAALLTAERADMHTLRVTNLPPGAEIRVHIVVVERLEAVDGQYRWRFPTTIAPRYTPGNVVGHTGPGVSPDTDRAPDASRLSPPILLGGGAKLDLEVDVRGVVRSVECSLHVAKVTLEEGGVRVAPQGGATVDRDFVVAWTTAAADRTDVRAYTDGTHTLVVIEPPASALLAPLPRDAVFVVDISGSMEGTKMAAAKQALSGALHGLMPGDRFRVIAFDDRLEHFRSAFATYDDASLYAADAWIAQLRARGGTDMLPAINAALDGETPAGRVRTVLFITDGQAHNEQELVAAVANRRGAARFFTLGIDTAVNEALLTRLARIGGGTCELCTPSDDIEAVVSRIEARFGMPLAEQVRIAGGELAGADSRALFAGRPVTALLRGAPAEVVVSGVGAGGAFEHRARSERVALPLGALWARERVAQLEDRLTLRPLEEEALRGEILRVALEHHVASRFTALVAVETTSTVTGPRVEVVQPAALPHGWDPGFSVGAEFMSALAAPAGALPPAAAPPPMGMPPAPPQVRARRRAAAPMADLARSAPEMDVSACEASDAAFGGPAPSAAPPAAEGGRAQAYPDSVEPGAELARTQSADGSYGGDVARTAAALLALVLLGHTRHVGLRKRAVLKAATWLTARSADPLASVALAALARVERGDDAGRKAELKMLAGESPEGRVLARVLAERRV